MGQELIKKKFTSVYQPYHLHNSRILKICVPMMKRTTIVRIANAINWMMGSDRVKHANSHAHQTVPSLCASTLIFVILMNYYNPLPFRQVLLQYPVALHMYVPILQAIPCW